MFNSQDDPLGLGLRQRARDAHAAYTEQNRELGRQNGQLVSFSNLGPLSDPMWDAFKQAYHEQGVGQFAGGSLPQSRFNEMTPFYDATYGADVMHPAQQAMASMKKSAKVRVGKR